MERINQFNGYGMMGPRAVLSGQSLSYDEIVERVPYIIGTGKLSARIISVRYGMGYGLPV